MSSANAPEDVLRSVQRFVALALGVSDVTGAPWSVSLSEEQILDEQRPFLVVNLLSALQPVGPYRITIPQGDVQVRASVTLIAFPEVSGSARECRARAFGVMSRLTGAVERGMVLTTAGGVESRFSYPMRLPLFDYDGVAVEGPGRAGPALPYAWMNVDPVPARPIADPDDDRRWTVNCDLGLTFFKAGAAFTAAEAGPVTAVVDPIYVP